eukprot:g551.t1
MPMTRWTEEEVGHLKRIATSKHFQCKRGVCWKKAHKELEKHIPHRSRTQCKRKWKHINCENNSTARVRKHRKQKNEEFETAARNDFRTPEEAALLTPKVKATIVEGKKRALSGTELIKFINPHNTAQRERYQKKRETFHSAAMNDFRTREEAALLTQKVKDTIVEGREQGLSGTRLVTFIYPENTVQRERQQKKRETFHSAAMNDFRTREEAALLTQKVKATIVEGGKKGLSGTSLVKYINPKNTYH